MKSALRNREVSRLEGFSDAVFAFSATLLVVSLEVPETFAELRADLHAFAAFALSFFALGWIWWAHNGFFRRYAIQDGATALINFCLLFVVLFYVYPLKFVARGIAVGVFGIGHAGRMITGFEDLADLFVVYGIGFVAVFLCLALLYWHAARRRELLQLDDEDVGEARFWARHYLIFVAVGLVSVALAAGGVGLRFALPGWIYGLIGLLCWAHARAHARTQAGADLNGARG